MPGPSPDTCGDNPDRSAFALGCDGHDCPVVLGRRRFRDRRDGGRALAVRLRELHLVDPVLLALPRGGVPVAAEVAALLHAPLEVFVARKIGLPTHPEFGVGAIAEGGEPLVDQPVLIRLGVSRADLAAVVRRERAELARRVERYRGSRPLPELRGRTAVLVDDGLATGVTARAALQALRGHEPERLVLAVPVGPPDAARVLAGAADDVVCVLQPEGSWAVGASYRHFEQVSDEQVLELLSAARR